MFIPSDDTPCLNQDDLFFSDVLMDIKDAKRLCQGCEFKMECAEEGMDAEYGVWGGLSVYERTRLRRNRRMNLRVV